MLVVSGACIASRIQARLAAECVAVFFLLSFLLLHVPENAVSLSSWGQRTSAKKVFSLAGCALVVAETLHAKDAGGIWRLPRKWIDHLIPFGRFPFALIVADFGLAHFRAADYVATLVPAWVPNHILWTYFAGMALIASGLAIIVRIMGRAATTLLGAMIFTWILVLHIPRAIADPYSNVGNEWTSTSEALAKSGWLSS
jgi:hypothetical protein